MTLLPKNRFALLLFLLGLSLLQSCSSYLHQPVKTRAARLGEETTATAELRKLPPAKEKLVAAVYKFRDQTGQYKPSDNGSNWSTAVTQGATNILLKALEESGWFVTIERENVANLLNERKIVRSSLTQYKNESENLPPLLFGGIILEGGIVSYDANVITGGAGLRYFGAGASTQYRQDRVTVYLRAVATRSGKILKTVYTSKTLLSQAVDGSLFRYVKFKRLLEAETGYSVTEPSQMIVTEAIEKAVYALVIEGIRDNLWSADEKIAKDLKTTLANYEAERKEMSETDIYGARNVTERPAFSIQPHGNFFRYKGDYPTPITQVGAGLALTYHFTPRWGLQLNAEVGILEAKRFFKTDITAIDGSLVYRTVPFQKTTPIFFAGGGMVSARGDSPWNLAGTPLYKWHAGAGFEHAMGKRVGLFGTYSFNQMLTDDLDGVVAGRYKDYYWRGAAGLSFYVGRSSKKKPQPVVK